MYICQRHKVRRLEMFGSAGKNEFDEKSSDLDFLVEFQDMDLASYADAYFGVLEDLGKLFERPIDLVVISSIKNPFFLQSINQDRELLYAA
jgi:hypothetical protein